MFVDSIVDPAGNGVLSAVADDQRHPRQQHSSLPGSSALRRLDVETPVDCNGKLVPNSISHIEPVQVGM